jgi:hypothetical protein
MPIVPSTQEARAEGLQDQGQPGKLSKPCLKINKNHVPIYLAFQINDTFYLVSLYLHMKEKTL